MKVDLLTFTNYWCDHEYIEEFCEHYFNLGVDVIHIVDDINGDNKKNTNTLIDIEYIKEKVLENKIEIIISNNRVHQHYYIPWFYNQYKDTFDWLCIFDSDEFLMLHKHNSISDYLSDNIFNDCDVIQIGWRIYGDNDIVYKPKGTTIQNYYSPKNERNLDEDVCCSKVIVHGGLNNMNFFIGHMAACNNNYRRIKYSNGQIVNEWTCIHKKDYSIAELAYFATRSAEEFAYRKSMGRIDAQNIPNYKVFIEAVEGFYKYNKKTKEKDDIFQNKLNEIINKKVKIIQTYYKPEQYNDYHLDRNPSFVKVVNTVTDKYPLSELNPFWSEYIYMKHIYETLDEYDCEYIGFDQYKRHFDYYKMYELISNGDDICILGDLGCISVYPQYCNDHKKKDIDNTIKILKESEFGKRVAAHWMGGIVPFFFGSCFVLRKDRFKEMCEFIFDIFDKMDKQYKLNYDVERYEEYFEREASKRNEYGNGPTEKTYEYQRRAFGYLLERLVSSWIILNYLPKKKIAKINLINEKEI